MTGDPDTRVPDPATRNPVDRGVAASGADTPRLRGPSNRPRTIAWRLVALAAAGFALLAGLDAALMSLGVGAPVRSERLAGVQGVLMVLGFVGTLIALDRAIALGRRWGFAAPALIGSAGIALVSPLPAAGALLVAGTAVHAAIFVPLWRGRRDAAVLVQALGAASALGGALLFTGGAAAGAYLSWLIGFVVLMIAGGRMELARTGRTGDPAGRGVLAGALALLAANVPALLFPAWGLPVLGAALLALVGALLRADVAVRAIRTAGLPRFGAACMLAGYAWLAVAGAILLLAPDPLDGGGYDAVVQAVFLGFTLSMIFAHAPVVLPAVLRRPLPYHPAMYVPAGLLHAMLAVRLIGGDLHGARTVWQAGGVGTVVAVLAFVVTAVTVGLTARVRPAARASFSGALAQGGASGGGGGANGGGGGASGGDDRANGGDDGASGRDDGAPGNTGDGAAAGTPAAAAAEAEAGAAAGAGDAASAGTGFGARRVRG